VKQRMRERARTPLESQAGFPPRRRLPSQLELLLFRIIPPRTLCTPGQDHR
jgi:hypothetical protein